MPQYFVTWLEQHCMGAHIEADTPEKAADIARGEPNGDIGATLQSIELEGDIIVELDGEQVHDEKA